MHAAFAATLPPGWTARMSSGVRLDNPSSQHAFGRAEDWHIYRDDGSEVPNRGPDKTGIFHHVIVQALVNYAYLNPQGYAQHKFAWGNYFETQKGSGQRDIMHADTGGARASPGFGDPLGIYAEANRLRAQFAQQGNTTTTPPAPQQGATGAFPWEAQPEQQQPEQPEQPATSQDAPATGAFPWETQPAAAQPEQPTSQAAPATGAFPWQQQQQQSRLELPEVPDAAAQLNKPLAPPDLQATPAQLSAPATQQAAVPAPQTPPAEPQEPIIIPDVPPEAILSPQGVPQMPTEPLTAAIAGAGQGAVTTVGQVAAGPGHLITGGTALAGHALEAAPYNAQQQARDQLAIMDRIDKGERFPAATVGQPGQGPTDLYGYQDMTPEQRQAFRAQYEQDLSQMAPPEQSVIYQGGRLLAKGGSAVGETVAVPGEWINTQGQKITPPAGYENAMSTNIGKAIGSLPVYVGSLLAGGVPAAMGIAASQTYAQSYQEQIKAGASPEDAAVNAGAKAIAASGLFAVPATRWLSALGPIEKRAAVAAIVHMAEDGTLMTGVGQLQHLVNNIVDKATTQPEKSVTEGLGQPEEMIPAFVAGTIPGAVGVAKSMGQPGPKALAAAWKSTQEAISKHLQDLWSATRPPAPPADESKVATGITTPPPEGRLVRATDSTGTTWVGHAGVLVREGTNPEVDQHFGTATARENVELKDVKPIDAIVTSANTEARHGIAWTDTTTTPDGTEVVHGHTADGHTVELDADRYAVLSKYGDVGANTYLTSRPGEAPIVAVRDPQTQQVVAIAQGQPISHETRPVDLTLETRDAAATATGATEPVPVDTTTSESRPFYAEPGKEAPQAAQATSGEPITMTEAREQGELPLAPQDTRTGDEGLAIPPRPGAETVESLTNKITDLRDRYEATSDPTERAQIIRDMGGLQQQRDVAYQAERGMTPAGERAADAYQAQLRPGQPRLGGLYRVPTTRRIPGREAPDITDRPSLFRQAYRDAGYDPDVAALFTPARRLQILGNHIEKTFGFKVHVDPKMQPQKAIDSMLDGYRNMQMMAHLLGASLKGMSLHGEINLRFEPWQPNPKKAYLGMMSINAKGEISIHMPDRSNSFAHEWTHALDHYLLRFVNRNPAVRKALTSQIAHTGALTNVHPGTLEEAVANVMRAIFHDRAAEAARIADLNMTAQTHPNANTRRAAAAEAQRIIAGGKPKTPIQPTGLVTGSQQLSPRNYWASPEEMLARAGEAYVAHLAEQQGGSNEFITKGDQEYLAGATQRFADHYPQAADRDAIFNAMNDMHAILQRDNILGSRNKAARPGDYDILDPVYWQYTNNPQSNPQLTNGLRRAVNVTRNWRQRTLQEMAERAGAQGVPTFSWKGVQHGAINVKDIITPHIYTNMGQLDVYRERYEALGNHRAAAIISNLLDKLGYRYGEGRLQVTPFERAANRITNPEVNKIDKILNDNGMPTNRLNLDNEKMLFDALRGRDAQGNTPVVPANIQRAAAGIDAVLKDMWYRIERAGINVGMPRDENYIPIVYDDQAIIRDGVKAKDVIADAMRADFNSKQIKDNTFIHEAYGALPRAGIDKGVQADMEELARVQEAMRTETDPGKLAALDRQQQDLLSRVTDPIREAWAQQRSSDWVHSRTDVPWARPGNKSGTMPTSDPLRQRVLSAEARDILANAGYIVTRPSELLPYYFHQMGRKLAFGDLFGHQGEVLEKAMSDLHEAGVLQEDREQIRGTIQSALGMLRSNEIDVGHKAAVWMRALGTMALMSHAAWSSISEPMVAFAQSGSARAAAGGFSIAMQDIMRQIGLIKGSERVQHLADISRVLGTTSTRLQEAMLTGRTEAFSWSPGHMMANFYRRTGLTQTTNGNKVGARWAAHVALGMYARDILAGRRGALFDPHAEMREMGIPNAEHDEFSKWYQSLNGRLPTINEILQTPMGQRWGEATTRFVEKVVLENTAAEKAFKANTPWGRFLYGLQSYNFMFQRAVLNPAFDRLGKTIGYEQGRLGKGAGMAVGAAKWATFAATAIGMMMIGQVPMAIVRQEIFDHKRAAQWRKDGVYMEKIFGLAFQRTGVGGVADPLVNAINAIKYEHEISSLFLGAQMNQYVQAITDILAPLTSGSPNTNTARYRAWRGMYQLFGMPVAALGMALAPAGPIKSWMWSGAGQTFLSQSAADTVATMMAGPKGEKTNMTPDEAEKERMKEYMPPDDDRLKEFMPPDDKQRTAEGSALPSSSLMGAVDDFIPPAARAVKRAAPAILRFGAKLFK
jgi:hypothetical protein